MNFQCIIPSFDPPKLKWQNMDQKLEVLRSLIPTRQEWNEEKDYSKYRTKSIVGTKDNNAMQRKTSKCRSEDISIQLFDGELQYQPMQAKAAPVIVNVESIPTKRVDCGKKKVSNVKINAFQRMMSTVLSAAENDDCELDETVTTTVSSSVKLLNGTSEISISEILSKRSDSKMSSQKNPSSVEKSKSNQPEKATKISRKFSELEAKLTDLPPLKKRKSPELTSSIVDNQKGSKTKEVIHDAIDFEMDFVAADFQNVQYFCRNAGSTSDVLTTFVSLVLSASSVGISLVYSDLSTNHASMSKKYCTPSTKCLRWNCTCDKHIRTQHISLQRVFGAIVYIPQSNDNSSSTDACYFLPLRRCVEPTSNNNSPPSSAKKQLPLKCDTSLNDRKQALRKIFASPNVCKVLFNVQVSAVALSVVTQMPTAPAVINISDPRVAVYLLNPEIDDASSLDLLPMLHDHRISLTPEKAISCDPQMIAHRGRIADVIYHTKIELIAIMNLVHILSHQLQQQKLTMVFHTLEMPLAFQLGALEEKGVAIDTSTLLHTEEMLHKQLQLVSEKIYELSGTKNKRFNIASPEQLSHLLFQQLLLIPPAGVASSTTSGKFISTSEETLSKIKDQHPIVDWILTFRSLFKLIHTYIDGLKPYINKRKQDNDEDNNSNIDSVHALWNQLIVRTGRLSCSKPNLQNIPTNFSLLQLSNEFHDIRIRSFFKARPGFCLVAVDYSQIEMRVLAHVTNDREMCALFRDRDGDIYKLLASKIFRKSSLVDVTDQERTRAKVICLGCIYGMGAKAAANKLGIDVATVSHITRVFFQHFKGVSQWIHRIQHYARQHQEVRTLSGRLRRLPGILSEQPGQRATAERQAVNTVIQGTASDLIKSAMLLVSRAVTQWEQSLLESSHVHVSSSSPPSVQKSTHLVMQIHDELILEVPLQFLDSNNNVNNNNYNNTNNNKDKSLNSPHVHAAVELIRRTMEEDLAHRWQLRVPLLTTVRIGETWGNMSPWKPSVEEENKDEGSSKVITTSSSCPEVIFDSEIQSIHSLPSNENSGNMHMVEDLVLSNSQYCDEIDRIILPDFIEGEIPHTMNMKVDSDTNSDEDLISVYKLANEEDDETNENFQDGSSKNISNLKKFNPEINAFDNPDDDNRHTLFSVANQESTINPSASRGFKNLSLPSQMQPQQKQKPFFSQGISNTILATSQRKPPKMPAFFDAMDSDSNDEVDVAAPANHATVHNINNNFGSSINDNSNDPVAAAYKTTTFTTSHSNPNDIHTSSAASTHRNAFVHNKIHGTKLPSFFYNACSDDDDD